MSNLKPSELGFALRALTALSDKDKEGSYSFPSAARIRMGTNIRKLRELVAKIEEEQNALFMKYGGEVDGKLQVSRTSDKWDEFEASYKALNAAPFEIDLQPMTEAELINSRVVKSRDSKGQVTEETVENQIPFDLIADLQSAALLPKT